MSKRKIAGLVLIIFSLLMIIGSAITHYPIIAQITWSLVAIVGLVLFFWGGFPKAKVNFSIKAQKTPIQDSKSRKPHLSLSYRTLMILLILVAFVGVLFFGLKKSNPSLIPIPQIPNNLNNHFPGKTSGEITVKATDSHYKIVSTKPTGWFSSGQDADIMLSGIDFNNAGGPLLFNHPGPLATDGTHLILSDTFNNRVLIWNKVPSADTPPDLVLGQKNFTANNPGKGLDEMNWPTAASAVGGKLVIADTNNSRILIWNSFPTKNDQAADLVINSLAHAPNVSKLRLFLWPWGVWTDGHKLLVSATAGGYVLVWNNFPTQNDQPADYYISTGDFKSSPRTIISDGKHLLVGMEEGIKTQGRDTGGALVWNNFPISNQVPDYAISTGGSWPNGMITPEGKLVTVGLYLDIWNSFPAQNINPDVEAGCLLRPGNSKCNALLNPGFLFENGNNGAVYIGGKLYISLFNSNKIVVYNKLPTTRYQLPDFTIGSPDINTNTLMTNYIYENPVSATDGKSLFVASNLPSQVGLYVYSNLPNQSGAYPDYVYDFPGLLFEPTSINIANGSLIVAGRAAGKSQGQNAAHIFIWSKLPLHGEMPDQTLTEKIGNIQLQWIGGATMDDKYFYVSDYGANKIYVFKGVPKDGNTEPVFVIPYPNPYRLSTDGNYLVVTDSTVALKGHGAVGIFDIKSLSSNSKPFILPRNQCDNPARLSAIISSGHLFVADTACNRVVIWKNINQALNNVKPDLTLGCTESDSACSDWAHHKIGINSLFQPGSLSFDGSYLWVGEDKFSDRLLRFSVR